MKKSYVKPQVYFEDFQLSASIAGDCGDHIIRNQAKGTCGYQMSGGLTIFLDSVSECREERGGVPVVDGKNDYTTFCYHNVDGPFFAS